MVAMDRMAAADMAVTHLIARGHRRIAMMQRNFGWYVNDGYEASMKRHGLAPRILSVGKTGDSPERFQPVRDALKDKATAPTALFVLNTQLASEFYLAAVRHGWKDVLGLELVGYDYAPWMQRLPVPITTVEQPIQELVTATLDIVLERLKNPGGPRKSVVLPFHLVVRE